MSKYGQGNFTLFLVDGFNLVASIAESAAYSKESISQQTNAFGAASEEHSPVALTRAVLNIGSGFYDETTDALHDAIGQVVGILRIICTGMEGNVIGKHFTGYAGTYSQKYEIQDIRDQLTKATVSYLVSGDIEEGVIVQNLATFTADWDTRTGGAGAADAPVDNTVDLKNRSINIVSNTLANPSVVTTATPHGLTTGQRVFISGVITSNPTINGERVVTVVTPTTFSVPVNVTTAGTGGSFVPADSILGGAGYLQVTAFSGFSAFIGTINDSVDDITYNALVTFVDQPAVGAQRITVVGQVDRYLSFNGNVTGSGSITAFAGFSRN